MAATMTAKELKLIELNAHSMTFPELYEAHKKVSESSDKIDDISTQELFDLCTLHMRVALALSSKFDSAQPVKRSR